VSSNLLKLLLADDDKDDCLFFQEALDELSLTSSLTTVHDGDQLMQLLNNPSTILPDVLFVDVNMPRKNGLECLTEIRGNEKFKNLPVIIYSTSYEQSISNLLYHNGAKYYIQKPSDFRLLKKIIFKALSLIADKNSNQPSMEKFLLNNEFNNAVT
jgi:CheY-like chemotaxis protein